MAVQPDGIDQSWLSSSGFLFRLRCTMFPPRASDCNPAILLSRSLELKSGLSLACNDCAPFGCLRDRVIAPGLLLRSFPQRLASVRLEAPRTGLLSDPVTFRHSTTRYTGLHAKPSCCPPVFSPLQGRAGFPSPRVLRAQRAQPVNNTSMLALISDPIFLCSPTAFISVDTVGSSFRIRYRLSGSPFSKL
jgi:hypothetical protein